jgi:hypothetical protein
MDLCHHSPNFDFSAFILSVLPGNNKWIHEDICLDLVTHWYSNFALYRFNCDYVGVHPLLTPISLIQIPR